MENLRGKIVSMLPFGEMKKISDLIYHEGPLLSHFKDGMGRNLFFYWVDQDLDFNRWLIFTVEESQINDYVNKLKSLKELIANSLDIFTVDIDRDLNYNNIHSIKFDELNKSYIPEE